MWRKEWRGWGCLLKESVFAFVLIRPINIQPVVNRPQCYQLAKIPRDKAKGRVDSCISTHANICTHGRTELLPQFDQQQQSHKEGRQMEMKEKLNAECSIQVIGLHITGLFDKLYFEVYKNFRLKPKLTFTRVSYALVAMQLDVMVQGGLELNMNLTPNERISFRRTLSHLTRTCRTPPPHTHTHTHTVRLTLIKSWWKVRLNRCISWPFPNIITT